MNEVLVTSLKSDGSFTGPQQIEIMDLAKKFNRVNAIPMALDKGVVFVFAKESEAIDFERAVTLVRGVMAEMLSS